MPVHKDPDGRRIAQAQAEVPGTPDDVWQAIASGPGISSWFVPSDVEGHVGGKVVSHFGPGNSMDSVAEVTVWEPPHRFVAESADMGPGAPVIATEWTVEAQAGGTCIVRVVHSWFAESDDWDEQFNQTEHGWVIFFRILGLYLRDFSGQPPATFQMMGAAPEPTAEAWTRLTDALGLTGADVGQSVEATGAPSPLAGTVEQVGSAYHSELLLRLTAPNPGIAHLFAMPMGGQIYLPIRVFLFGPEASRVAGEIEPVWQAWMAERFPIAPAAEPAPGNG